MRLHAGSTTSVNAYTAVAPVAATLFCASVLLYRARPYDAEAAVERVYQALRSIAVNTGEEYDTTKWVCIPVSMDVTNQFVDLSNLMKQINYWGCTVVASAVTDHPNRRNLVVRVPKRRRPSRWLDLLATAGVVINIITIYAYHVGMLR